MSAANDAAPDSGRRSRADFALGDHQELARAMAEDIETDAPIVFDLAAFHAYRADRGVWEVVPESTLGRIFQGYSGATVADPMSNKVKSLRLRYSDFTGALGFAKQNAARDGFFSDAPAGFAFANGFARITDKGIALEPHAPEHAARFAFPFAFDRSAPCVRWLATLRDVFQGDADADAKIAGLQELAGASLFGIAPRYQKAFVMYGDGANGKSLIANVIAAAFPKEAVCAVEPQAWGQDYKRALLAGKLLNVVNEMPEADILSGDDFKNVVTGEPKTARNPSEKAFTFKARAGHLFAANKLPGSNDHSHGFWRRLVVISFNRVFRKDEQNPNLADEIIATEMPGIVAWMVEGAMRLLRRGRYTEIASSDAALSRWKREADAVATFVEERTVPAAHDNDRTTATTLYATYREWATESGFKPMNRNSFGRRMTGLGLGSKHTESGQVYPVRLLRSTEHNPRDAERAMAEAAAAEAAQAERTADPGDDFPRA